MQFNFIYNDLYLNWAAPSINFQRRNNYESSSWESEILFVSSTSDLSTYYTGSECSV